MLQFQHDISLKPYNTFGLDAFAKMFIQIYSKEDMQLLVQTPEFQSHYKFILGGGSNIVMLNKTIEGLVIKNAINGLEILEKKDDNIYIKAGAGVAWHDFVIYCVDNNFGGVENLSLIPGTVGAAPMQNIGAYGVELEDVFESLEAVQISTGRLVRFDTKQCQFGYRESVFKNTLKNQFIIVSVTFRLTTKHIFNVSYGAIKEHIEATESGVISIKSISDAVIAIRKSKLPDPKILGNCGSFFKNPEIEPEFFKKLEEKYPKMPHFPLPNNKIKLAAGWLIEQCGWKGKIIGNVGAHKDQALVIVNYGNATGNEIINIAKEIQKSVFITFDVLIEMEVNVI